MAGGHQRVLTPPSLVGAFFFDLEVHCGQWGVAITFTLSFGLISVAYLVPCIDSQCQTPSLKVPLGADVAPRQAPLCPCPCPLLPRKPDMTMLFSYLLQRARVCGLCGVGGADSDLREAGLVLGGLGQASGTHPGRTRSQSEWSAGCSRSIQEQTAWHSQMAVRAAVDPTLRGVATRLLLSSTCAVLWLRHV
jgi:hypothetical protein